MVVVALVGIVALLSVAVLVLVQNSKNKYICWTRVVRVFSLGTWVRTRFVAILILSQLIRNNLAIILKSY